jgi:hypothetical protein
MKKRLTLLSVAFAGMLIACGGTSLPISSSDVPSSSAPPTSTEPSSTSTTTSSATPTSTPTSTTPSSEVPPPDLIAPIILGADTAVEITLGDDWDPLTGVIATDNKDGNLTSSIEVSSTYELNVPGSYSVVYSVTDAAGNTTQVIRRLTVSLKTDFVLANPEFTIDSPKFLNANNISNNNNATDQAKPEYSWGFHQGDEAAFVAEIKDGMAQIDVISPGRWGFGVQFYQYNRKVTLGNMYQITFRMKAEYARPVNLVLESSGISPRPIDALFDIGEEWGVYTYRYEAKQSFVNGKFGFFLGTVGTRSVPGMIWIDYVRINQLNGDFEAPNLVGLEDAYVPKNATFDPLEGFRIVDNVEGVLSKVEVPVIGSNPIPPFVQVTGTVDTGVVGVYDLSYKTFDSKGNEAIYQRKIHVIDKELYSALTIENGDMEIARATEVNQIDSRLKNHKDAFIGSSGRYRDWNWHRSSAGDYYTVDINAEDDFMRVNITNPVDHPWSPHVYQLHRSFDPSTVYEISFRARATVNRAISLRIEQPIGQTLYSKDFDITTDWVTYTARIDTTLFSQFRGIGGNDAKVAFFMGALATPTNAKLTGVSNAHEVHLDNVESIVVNSPKYLEDATASGLRFTTTLPTVAVNGHASNHFNPYSNLWIFSRTDKQSSIAEITITSAESDPLKIQGVRGSFGYYIPLDQAGVYNLTYTLVDRFNVTHTLTRVVTVAALPA